MKKPLVLLAVLVGLVGNQSLSAQNEAVSGKLIYGELGGPGVFMSANWDARFKSNERLGFGYRLGIGFGLERFENKVLDFLREPYFNIYIRNENKEVTKTFYCFPVGLNYVLGKPNKISTFEIGAGITLMTRKAVLYTYQLEKPGNVIGFATFMYRMTPANGGFSFRVGFTPMIGTSGDLVPMAAVGFGYAF